MLLLFLFLVVFVGVVGVVVVAETVPVATGFTAGPQLVVVGPSGLEMLSKLAATIDFLVPA